MSLSVSPTLSPVTTAGGLYPALDTAIIQLTMPYMPSRAWAVTRSLVGQPGDTAVFAKQNASRSAVFSEIAPGALIPMDSTPYSYSGVTVYKIAEGFLATRELIEDSMLPIIQDNMVRFGIRAANKIDLDIITAMYAGAGNTVVSTGNSLGSTGTLFGPYRGGALGQQDIVQAIRSIKMPYNYFPDRIAISPVQEQDLFMLPMFTLAWQYGSSIVKEGTLTATPENPIYGIKVEVSNNITAGMPMILASGQASNAMNQYSPGIFFVEKRPLTTQQEQVPGKDAQAVYFSARYAPSVQVSAVICTITGLASN